MCDLTESDSGAVQRPVGAKLSAAQTDLLEAMRRGVTCLYMPHGRPHGAYYFRTDTMRHCTKSAVALLTRGLVEKFGASPFGHNGLRALAETQRSSRSVEIK